MNKQQYMQLVRRLELDASIHPAAFRIKVILISASVYLVTLATLAGAAALVWLGSRWAEPGHGLFAMLRLGLLALLMLPLLLVVLRMACMRLPAPAGRRLTRHEAPVLFKALARMRRRLKGPPIHHVLINDEYNAAISQLPRFGMLAGHTNYLMLGLPYLLGVPVKEMLATVAHEYGHLAGNHGKLGAWVYRQRRTFGALHEQVCEAADASVLHAGIATALNRFMPYYNAYTFVLSRQNEYQADHTATQLIGSEINAAGLVRDALLGRWIEEQFWPELYRQADHAMRPSFMPFKAMRTAFQTGYAQWATPERLAAALMEQSGWHDTHPSLRERVEATGEAAALPRCVHVTAAEVLLGATTSKGLIDEFDQNWWKNGSKQWEARCRHANRARARLTALSIRAVDDLPLQDLQELALLRAEFVSPQAAKPVLEHLLRQPGGPFPKAECIYGRVLLEEGSDLGLPHLEAAARHDGALVDQAAHLGFFHLLRHQGDAAARAWWERLVPALD
ncbi:MAG: M48 family metallopeptidase [Pseudomonadota bacterium]